MTKLVSGSQIINIVEDGTVTINIGPFTLTDGRPTVNGAPLNDVRVAHSVLASDEIQVTYKTTDFSWCLEAQALKDNSLEMRVVMQNFTPSPMSRISASMMSLTGMCERLSMRRTWPRLSVGEISQSENGRQ